MCYGTNCLAAIRVFSAGLKAGKLKVIAPEDSGRPGSGETSAQHRSSSFLG